jgi:hypothetical protein
MGLHHDPSKFSLSPPEAARRRRLLGELYTNDTIASLHLSRPTAFGHLHCDVKPLRIEELPYAEQCKPGSMSDCTT